MSITDHDEIIVSLGQDGGIPVNLHDGIALYIADGIEPGSFLRAVFENNLTESFARADLYSRACMFYIVQWLYQHCPNPARGSKEAVEAWIKRRGMNG